MELHKMWNVGSSSVAVNQAKEIEDKPSTSISMKVHCVCCAAIPCWSIFTKNHSKQGHSNIHATLCLSEVRRSRVRVQIWADFKHSGQRMHNHHPAFCPGHQLWCQHKQSTCLWQKTKMVNTLRNMMVTQQRRWWLSVLGSGAVLLGQQSPPVLWRIILPSNVSIKLSNKNDPWAWRWKHCDPPWHMVCPTGGFRRQQLAANGLHF